MTAVKRKMDLPTRASGVVAGVLFLGWGLTSMTQGNTILGVLIVLYAGLLLTLSVVK